MNNIEARGAYLYRLPSMLFYPFSLDLSSAIDITFPFNLGLPINKADAHAKKTPSFNKCKWTGRNHSAMPMLGRC